MVHNIQTVYRLEYMNAISCGRYHEVGNCGLGYFGNKPVPFIFHPQCFLNFGVQEGGWCPSMFHPTIVCGAIKAMNLENASLPAFH